MSMSFNRRFDILYVLFAFKNKFGLKTHSQKHVLLQLLLLLLLQPTHGCTKCSHFTVLVLQDVFLLWQPHLAVILGPAY